MKKKFVIRDANGYYYDSIRDLFGGINTASFFGSKKDAKASALSSPSGIAPVAFISKVYTNFSKPKKDDNGGIV